MQMPLEIAFHGLPHDDRVESVIRERTAKLDGHFGRITSCRVAVERPHKSKGPGTGYAVRVDLRIPGQELVVRRDADDDAEQDPLEAVVLDAFDAAERRLERTVERVRDEARHPEPGGGQKAGVVKVVADDQGLIETPEGEEVRFLEGSLLDFPFADVEPGFEVEFAEAPEGGRASTVRVVSWHPRP